MGLFEFIRDAGEKIFGGGQVKNEEMGTKLTDMLEKFGLKKPGVEVSVEGEKAVLKGTALTQEEKEKMILLLGNTSGISKVEDNMTVSQAGPSAKFYTVKSGDTLSKIAKEFYGDANKYPTIFEANKPMLTHPDKIYPGQVLRIP